MEMNLSTISKIPADLAADPIPSRRETAPGETASLRVLMVVESAGAGTGRHVLDLAEGLQQRGVEVHVIYSTGRVDDQFLDRLAELKDVRHRALHMRTAPHPSDIGVLWAVRRYMRKFGQFDVIHGHSSKGGAIARLAALGTPTTAFYTLHGLIMMDPQLARWKWLLYYAIERGLSLRTSRIIAVSPEERRAAVKLGFGDARLAMIPNGIEQLKLTPRAEARRTMGVTDDALVIGFVGRLVEQKAPEVLIEAFASASVVSPQLRLALVGSGPLGNSMRKLAVRLGIEDKVIFLGSRDARGVYAGFDLFAMASRKEGLPYVVLEAMATGLPVVATSTSGVEILVVSDSNGTVVPPDDVGAFAQALMGFATNPEKLARASQAALERVRQFSIGAMVESTLAVYRDSIALK
jgi:glycosyltransferase involved in cell wall biosynthesis